tara:strand:- start:80 stop:265 length:186 start_codon:yes stop_codon:yes gene_type:complete
MGNTPIVNLQFTLQGAELMIAALRKLPHEQVHDLVQQTWDQYQAEIKRLQEPAPVEQIDAE